jgi:hypothetical protein
MSAARKQLTLRNNGRAHSSNASHARARRLARWQAAFLRALRKSPNVTAACRAAGISRFTAYKHREDNEAFSIKWDESLSVSVDRCEEKAFDMAWKGDSQLLQFILKAHRPAIYRERTEVAVAGGIIFLPQKTEGAE